MKVLTEVSRRSNCVDLKVKLCRNRPKGQYCSLPKTRTHETVLQSRLCKGQIRAGRGSVLWKGLWRRSSKGKPGVGRGRVLGRVCEEGWWRVRCEKKIRGARWLNWSLLSGSEAGQLETARVILKTRQTRYVDGQSSKWWRARKTLRRCL